MPYDPDTGVAEGLLTILDRKVGRRRASTLLGDHLDDENDKVTRLALCEAAGSDVKVRRTVVDGHMETRVTFETILGSTAWNGDTLDISEIPAVMADAATGRPLSQVVGHPLLPDAPIAGVEDRPGGRRIRVERRDTPMRRLRPAAPVRALAGWRRVRRRMALARRLHANEGLTVFTVGIGLLAGIGGFLAAGVSALLVGAGLDWQWMPVDLIGIAGGVVTACLTTRTLSGMTRQDHVVSEYIRDRMAEIARTGHPETARFDIDAAMQRKAD